MSEHTIPEDQVPEEPDLEPQEPEPEPVETRGLGWLIMPTLLGGLLGGIIGLIGTTGPHPKLPAEVARQLWWQGALGGVVIGLIAGGALGLLVWVVFPYKSRNPHAPRPEEKPGQAGAAPDAKDEHIT
jgi:hypothetical protein